MRTSPASKLKVAVGMSGGVDSSYAAWMLQNQGYSVVGMTMSVYGGEPVQANRTHACYGPGEQEDIARAQEVARMLGIAHHTLDLKAEYGNAVVQYFKQEYLRGRTPNPCVRCNPVVKFGFMLDKARQLGVHFDRFATGHYARVQYCQRRKRHVLRKGVDNKKDQSYFLYGLKSDLLPQLLFPIGGLTKEEVRKRAEEASLPVSWRRESQDFMEGGHYAGLFEQRQVLPGPIVDTSGRQLGIHRGIINYTIGQRRGIRVQHPEPLYVLRIDPEANCITVGPEECLLSRLLTAVDLNYVSIDPPSAAMRIKAKIRHSQNEADAELVPLERGKAKVVFDAPQRAMTPGQSVVFYDADVLLGGGVIDTVP